MKTLNTNIITASDIYIPQGVKISLQTMAVQKIFARTKNWPPCILYWLCCRLSNEKLGQSYHSKLA